MRLLIPLLLLTLSGNAQLSPNISYGSRIKVDFFRDSVSIDTLDLKGSFLRIQLDSNTLNIEGLDTFAITLITALPDTVFEMILSKEIRRDSAGIQLINVEDGYRARIDPNFLYLEYPRIRKKRNDSSVLYENSYTCYYFTLVRQLKSVSN